MNCLPLHALLKKAVMGDMSACLPIFNLLTLHTGPLASFNLLYYLASLYFGLIVISTFLFKFGSFDLARLCWDITIQRFLPIFISTVF